MKAVALDEPSIGREWGVFHSPKREPSLVEEAFIGLCQMAFESMSMRRGEAADGMVASQAPPD